VFTIRCTRKLLDRLGVRPTEHHEELAPDPTTRLGDWHANLLYQRSGQIVMLVSDRTLLPVLVPAAPKQGIVERFLEALAAELGMLGVPQRIIRRELAEMTSVRLGPTRSRQVLGTMNDFDRMLDHYLAREGLADAALHLAKAPCSPIGMRSPNDVAVELLASGGE